MRSLMEAVLSAFFIALLLEQGNRVTRALIWAWTRLAPAQVRDQYRNDWEADVATIDGPASRIGTACLLGTNLPKLWHLHGTGAEAHFVGLRILLGSNLLACMLAVICVGVQWTFHITLTASRPVNLTTSWCTLTIILVMLPFLWQDVRQKFQARAYLKGLYDFTAVAFFFVPMAASCVAEIRSLPQHTGSLTISSLLFAGIYVTVLYRERREYQKRATTT